MTTPSVRTRSVSAGAHRADSSSMVTGNEVHHRAHRNSGSTLTIPTSADDDGVAGKQIGKRDLQNIHRFPLTAGDRRRRIAKMLDRGCVGGWSCVRPGKPFRVKRAMVL